MKKFKDISNERIRIEFSNLTFILNSCSVRQHEMVLKPTTKKANNILNKNFE